MSQLAARQLTFFLLRGIYTSWLEDLCRKYRSNTRPTLYGLIFLSVVLLHSYTEIVFKTALLTIKLRTPQTYVDVYIYYRDFLKTYNQH